eukprot:scaffold1881_cov181-Ochromonas_danica.AAC.17
MAAEGQGQQSEGRPTQHTARAQHSVGHENSAALHTKHTCATAAVLRYCPVQGVCPAGAKVVKSLGKCVVFTISLRGSF